MSDLLTPCSVLAGGALLYAGLALAAAAHEVGHALGVLLGGQKLASLEIGLGWPSLVLRRRAPHLALRPLPLGGRCFGDADPDVLKPRARALQLAMGPFANLVAALVSGALFAHDGQLWLLVVCAGQAVFLVAQLIPLPAGRGGGDLGTDGAQLLELIRRGRAKSEARGVER